MRKLAASFFLIVYLFANTELHELTKFGALVDHYAQHKEEDPDMTLLDFLVIHYFSGNIVDADYAQDMQLPFKATDCSNSIPSLPHALPDFCDLSIHTQPESSSVPLYDQTLLPSMHLSDIWQPPKAC